MCNYRLVQNFGIEVMIEKHNDSWMWSYNFSNRTTEKPILSLPQGVSECDVQTSLMSQLACLINSCDLASSNYASAIDRLVPLYLVQLGYLISVQPII